MLETILYTAVHLGVKEIVVVGWDIANDEINKDDVSYTEDHKHFYGSTKNLLNKIANIYGNQSIVCGINILKKKNKFLIKIKVTL